MEIEGRLFSGDLVRCVAVIIVVVTHATDEFTYSSIPNNVSNWWVTNILHSIGFLGVPLFILLSGMLLLNPSKVNEPLGVFFRKRLSRIAVPLVFWGFAYYAWREFALHQALTVDEVWRGFLGISPYPYGHFWFLYVLIGLYLLTPILRVLLSYASSAILRYFLLLWFVGTAVVPILERFTSFYLGSDILIITGYVGYFVLGGYLQTVRMRSRFIYAVALVLGMLCTTVGTWFLTIANGGNLDPFFYDLLGANVILASLGLFMLLRDPSVSRLRVRFPYASSLVEQISLCSFAIYLFHPMVIDVLSQIGLFGFHTGIITLAPVLGVPLLAFSTFFISFGVVWLLRRIPTLGKAIG